MDKQLTPQADVDVVSDTTSNSNVEAADVTKPEDVEITLKQPKAYKDPIKNICILDAATGFTLFEKVYQWSQHATAANFSSLIQSFYQFAREVDDGNIVSVSFEGGTSRTNQRRRKYDSSFKHRSLNSSFDTMQMICVRSEKVVVAVCYDLKGLLFPLASFKEKMDCFIHEIRNAFEFTHERDIRNVRDQYAHSESDMSYYSLETAEELYLKLPFKNFNQNSDYIKNKYFHNHVDDSSAGALSKDEAQKSFHHKESTSRQPYMQLQSPHSHRQLHSHLPQHSGRGAGGAAAVGGGAGTGFVAPRIHKKHEDAPLSRSGQSKI